MKSSERPLAGFSGEARHTLTRVPPLPPALRDMLREGRMLHTVCLEEPGAARRRETAIALAGAILCEKGHGAMCGACLTCRKIMAGAHADLTVCDPAEDKDVYKKDNLRALRADAIRRPVEGCAKVYLLQDAQLIPAEGQNLLLKIIEEPPEDTFFLLTCPNRYRLLPTVLSRVAVFRLAPLSQEECLAALQEQAPGRSQEEYGRALIRCGGSPATGVQLLNDPAVQKRYAAAEEMMAGLAMANAYRVLAAAAPLERDRAGYAALLETLSSLLADPTLQKVYNLPQKAALRFRACIAPLTELCERNAHLPLVTALLAKRCLHP